MQERGFGYCRMRDIVLNAGSCKGEENRFKLTASPMPNDVGYNTPGHYEGSAMPTNFLGC